MEAEPSSHANTSSSTVETEAVSMSSDEATEATNSTSHMEIESQKDSTVPNFTNTTEDNTPFITVVSKKQKVKGKKKSYIRPDSPYGKAGSSQSRLLHKIQN
ncbi:1144_t:CDS:1 [Ambispora leptoticha]|uniref:1144_t:CDS:1 n=1 Tax=Ambispora leptoticha TaxID=144679 RepID=A0A9N9G9V3_9GLOM|nr:1144_t:CDS:1 [Ambispora leptoticha]